MLQFKLYLDLKKYNNRQERKITKLFFNPLQEVNVVSSIGTDIISSSIPCKALSYLRHELINAPYKCIYILQGYEEIVCTELNINIGV